MSDDLSLFLGSPTTSSEVEEIDEMGRSRESDAGPSSAVRRARRSERDARRLRRRVRPTKQEEAGYSTDATLGEGDAEDYNSAQRNLARRVHGLLEDVKAEDFRDPSIGLARRFGDWRRRYEEEYVGAFGRLALVQAWEFWVRGEMVGWEPLRVPHFCFSYQYPCLLIVSNRKTRLWNRSAGSLPFTTILIPDLPMVTLLTQKWTWTPMTNLRLDRMAI